MRPIVLIMAMAITIAAFSQKPNFSFGSEDTKTLWKEASKFKTDSKAQVLGDFQLLTIIGAEAYRIERSLKIKILADDLPNDGKINLGSTSITSFLSTVYKRKMDARDGIKFKSSVTTTYDLQSVEKNEGSQSFTLSGRASKDDIVEISYVQEFTENIPITWMGAAGFELINSEYYIESPSFYTIDFSSQFEGSINYELINTATESYRLSEEVATKLERKEDKVEYKVMQWKLGAARDAKELGTFQVSLDQKAFDQYVETEAQAIQLKDEMSAIKAQKAVKEVANKVIIAGAYTEKQSFRFGSKDMKLLWAEPKRFMTDEKLVGLGDFQMVTNKTDTSYEVDRKLRFKVLANGLDENATIIIPKSELVTFEARIYKRKMLQSSNIQSQGSLLFEFTGNDLVEDGSDLVFKFYEKANVHDIVEISYTLERDFASEVVWEGYNNWEFELSEFLIKLPYYYDVTPTLKDPNIEAIGTHRTGGRYAPDTLLIDKLNGKQFRMKYDIQKWATRKTEAPVIASFGLALNAERFNEFATQDFGSEGLLLEPIYTPKEDSIIRKVSFEEELYTPRTSEFVKQYPDADAFIHYDRAINDLTNGKFTRNTRIEILTKEGLGRGDFETQYISTSPLESLNRFFSSTSGKGIGKIKVLVYNRPDDLVEISEMDKGAVYKVEIDDDGKVYRFSAPDVQVGSIIDVSYTINGFLAYNWTFQEDIPIIESDYKVVMPEFVNFSRQMRGYIPIEYNQSYERRSGTQSKVYHFKGKNIPPFKNEPFIDSPLNYKTGVSFSYSGTDMIGGSLSTWDNVIEILEEIPDFGNYLVPGKTVRQAVSTIKSQYSNESDIIYACYKYVQDTLTWNDINVIFASGSQEQVFKKGAGNVADINLLLISMLRRAGLSANPILTKPRSQGIMSFARPRIWELNYVLCGVKIDGELKILDATDKTRSWNVLPLRALNTFGVVINEENGAFENVMIPENQAGKSRIFAQATLSEDGSIKGVCQKSSAGFLAYQFREAADSLEVEQLESNISNLQEGVTVKDYQETIPVDLGKSVKNRFNFETESQWIGDQLFVNPFIVMFVEENPFKEEERTYPVSIPVAYDFSYSLTLTTPENVVVSSLPQNEQINLPVAEGSGSILVLVKQMDKSIQLTYKVSLDKATTLPDEYDKIKWFYDQVMRKQLEKMVFAKVN